ncbi:ethanolamine ammonia-lyase small subunit [Brochothrix campestris FSL F6-1037]|uniref:Ethanolamine ammonia-lyase small subunit n=2 Tax=Brochothrix campestris TaxID=2757 RepID=W7CJG9_9LIST|nr:ethanolamine ammonia-lyase subunit EutC [Brochothrix campestris]EUJ36985.1 ethanolamine ammonia-lyase small subunit [Brochothrix campestris FSL F6-1037]
MNEKDLKQMIEEILTEMTDDKKTPVTAIASDESATATTYQPTVADVGEGMIPDITDVIIKEQFFVPNAHDEAGYMKMKQFTPARLGLWRAGTRYKTQSILRFRADHAAAQDAVFSYVDEELVKEMQFISTETVCRDKDEYVTRPDLGRVFSDEMCQKIVANTTKSAKIQIVVGDGLSSAAIGANIRDIIPSIKQGLKMYNLDFAKVVFVKHCRVPAMDKIGELTDADVVCLLVGERPGLVTAESMSAYIAYRPTVGMPEARRTVISNIHKGGTPPVEAGAFVAELIKEMLDKKKSGIDLKEA